MFLIKKRIEEIRIIDQNIDDNALSFDTSPHQTTSESLDNIGNLILTSQGVQHLSSKVTGSYLLYTMF